MKRLMKKLSKQVYPSLRMRRLRNNSGIRKLISETKLSVENLIQPIFDIFGNNAMAIMPKSSSFFISLSRLSSEYLYIPGSEDIFSVLFLFDFISVYTLAWLAVFVELWVSLCMLIVVYRKKILV